jgi:hypothetical protein
MQTKVDRTVKRTELRQAKQASQKQQPIDADAE